jgi:hypothetical protein
MTDLHRAAAAAAAWSEFPVAQVPRPIVFLDTPVHIGDRGFVDEDAKLAWSRGAIESEVALPDGLMELILENRAHSASARALVVSGVQECEETFLCDRGRRVLSAYRLWVSGLAQACTVVDPTVEFWWPPRGEQHVGVLGSATVAADDVTIEFPAFGGALTEFHRAEFVEFPTCVVGHAVTSEQDVPPGTAIPAIGIRSMVKGRLDAPLDGRVLVHTDGTPVAVLQQGTHSAIEEA